MGKLLDIRGLSASADEKPILHDIDLTIGEGETHVLMGPNGAGKSTLGQVIMGNPEYTVTTGSITLAGEEITEKAVDARSRAGLFMSFQAPTEVPGVPLHSFLRAIVAQHDELQLKGKHYKKRVAQIRSSPFSTRPIQVSMWMRFPLSAVRFPRIAMPAQARCSSSRIRSACSSISTYRARTSW